MTSISGKQLVTSLCCAYADWVSLRPKHRTNKFDTHLSATGPCWHAHFEVFTFFCIEYIYFLMLVNFVQFQTMHVHKREKNAVQCSCCSSASRNPAKTPISEIVSSPEIVEFKVTVWMKKTILKYFITICQLTNHCCHGFHCSSLWHSELQRCSKHSKGRKGPPVKHLRTVYLKPSDLCLEDSNCFASVHNPVRHGMMGNSFCNLQQPSNIVEIKMDKIQNTT